MAFDVQSYLFNMTRLGNEEKVILSRCHNNEVELGQHSNAHMSVNTHRK